MIDDRVHGENLTAEWLLRHCEGFRFYVPGATGRVSVRTTFMLTGDTKTFTLTPEDQNRIRTEIDEMSDPTEGAVSLRHEINETQSHWRDFAGPGRE